MRMVNREGEKIVGDWRKGNGDDEISDRCGGEDCG